MKINFKIPSRKGHRIKISAKLLLHYITSCSLQWSAVSNVIKFPPAIKYDYTRVKKQMKINHDNISRGFFSLSSFPKIFKCARCFLRFALLKLPHSMHNINLTWRGVGSCSVVGWHFWVTAHHWYCRDSHDWHSSCGSVGSWWHCLGMV